MKLERIILCIFLICVIVFPIHEQVLASTDTVYVIPVKGIIDQGLVNFVKDNIVKAERSEAAAIAFEIDTPGGDVRSAVELSDVILAIKVPTASFINNEATSAGVIIAISADEIYAVPRATIGAAETRPKEEKYISYWSSKLRSVAEITGRNPEIIAAMADADIVIEGIKDKGKILSLTTGEAVKLGVVDKEIINTDELVQQISLSRDIKHLERVDVKMGPSDRIAQMATNPYISPILLTLGIVGTLIEIITPGFGIPGIIGLVGFGLFFGGSFLAGTAQSWVLILFILGLILLVVEIFIPGFGVFGISGILSIITSVIIAFPNTTQALISVSIALVASGMIIFLLFKYVLKATVFNRLILGTKQDRSEGYIVSSEDVFEYLHKVGVAITPLRPAGSALIDGKRVDVITQGEFIVDGTKIEVDRVEGNKIIVKKTEQESE